MPKPGAVTSIVKAPKPTLAQLVGRPAPQQRRRAAPLWTGPSGEGPNGGVTQGLVSRWLCCPERARVRLVEGIKPADDWSHYLFFGSAWHVCEEALAASCNPIVANPVAEAPWAKALREYCAAEAARNRLHQDAIDKWYNVIKVTFPVYADWWARHPDVQGRTPLLQEHAFDVPYRLPSGRTVRLRGRWDSVDLVGGGIWLQENKTKSDIDQQGLTRQLTRDLQSMLYLAALCEYQHDQASDDPLCGFTNPIAGIRYNVIRRPLSGGRGSITQSQPTKGSKCSSCNGDGAEIVKQRGKPPKSTGSRCPKCGGSGRVGAKDGESKEAFYARLGEIIKSAHGKEWESVEGEHYFFKRWQVAVTPTDIERFRRETLDPILENIYDDYEWWDYCYRVKPGTSVWDTKLRRKYSHHCPRHYVRPFGVYNAVDEAGWSDVDAYLNSGSMAGLIYYDDVFPELK